MKNTLVTIILCGIVLFFWGFLSWAVIPWHSSSANKLTDESEVAQVLKQNAPASGIYFLPFAEEDVRKGETTAFLNIIPNGYHGSMGSMMTTGMVGQMLSAFLVLTLLQKTSLTGYWEKVRFVSWVGFIIGFVGHFSYWNWFEFSSAYVVVIILDSLIAWTLAGLVMAKFAVTQNRDSQ